MDLENKYATVAECKKLRYRPYFGWLSGPELWMLPNAVRDLQIAGRDFRIVHEKDRRYKRIMIWA